MTASIFTQFLLLFKKNILTCVTRNKVSFLKEILCPALVTLLLLWIRGFVKSDQRENYKFDKVELKSWPPGLIPNVHIETGDGDQKIREFVLLYNNDGNSGIDSFMDETINYLDENAVKWLSYEEYVLDQAIYQPTLNYLVNETTTLTDVCEYSKTFLNFCMFDDTQENRQVWGNLTVEEKQDFVKNNIVDDLKGALWNHCKRSTTNAVVRAIAEQLACTPPSNQAGRVLGLSEFSFPEFNELIKLSWKKSKIDTSVCEEEIQQVSAPENFHKWARVRQNLRQSRLVIDLASHCGTDVSEQTYAWQIHSENPLFTIKSMSFSNEEEMNNFMKDEENNKSVLERRLAAVVFDEVNFDNATLKYALRLPPTRRNFPPGRLQNFKNGQDIREITRPGENWKPTLLKRMLQLALPVRDKPKCSGGIPHYHTEGFTILQDALDRTFTQISTSDNLQASFRKFWSRLPFGKYSEDIFPIILSAFSSLIFTLGTMYLVLNSTKAVVTERQVRIKEYMKIMGASNFMQWSAWTVYYAILSAIISFEITQMITSKKLSQMSFEYTWGGEANLKEYFNNDPAKFDEAMDKINAILPNSEKFPVFLCIWVNCIQLVWFHFMLSALFDTASNASAVGGMVHFFISSFFGIFTLSYSDIPLKDKQDSVFFPGLALGHFWYHISILEGTGDGLTMKTFPEKYITKDNDFSIQELTGLMVNNIILYMIITWYIEKIRPGEFGVAEKWYFIFNPKYWMNKCIPQKQNSMENDKNAVLEDCEVNDGTHYEKPPTDAEISVKLTNLYKEFKSLDGIKKAVNMLNLETCHGQITSLLGHNGAGKTTTMNILTGMIEATSGEASINGYNVKNQLSQVRSSLGLCPQFDILFPMMTVKEHLYFFAEMKGVSKNKLKNHVEKLIDQMLFQPYVNNYPTELSGGWKRRLSVCIAIIGNSKVVILDEPTSGMDPSTRRILWNQLLQIKKTRTIILSTHFMDEADILGDRIGIMSHGRLEAIGTSNYLKSKFGAGYHILFSAENVFDKKLELQILNVIRKFIKDASVERNIGQEMSILLPFQNDQKEFSKIFKEIEQSKAKFGISSYGVSLTSLDEVFLKLTEKAKERDMMQAVSKNKLSQGQLKNMKPIQNRKTGATLFWSRLKASINKNWIVTKRDKGLYWTCFILPVMWAAALVQAKQMFGDKMYFRDGEKVRLDLSTKTWFDEFKIDNQKMTTFVDLESFNETEVQFYDKMIQSMNNNSVGYKEHICLGNESACNSFVYGSNSHTSRPYPEFEEAVIDKFNDIRNTEFDRQFLDGVGFGRSPYGLGDRMLSEGSSPNWQKTLFMIFNGQHVHTVASAVNTVSNALLKYVMAVNGASQEEIDNAMIVTYNQPLPMNSTEKGKMSQIASTGDNGGLNYSGDLTFMICLVVSLFIKYKVNEDVLKSKHVQQLTGMSTFTYWLSFYAMDILKCCVFFLPTALTFGTMGDSVFGFRNKEALADHDISQAWLYLYLYFVLTCLATLPFFYIYSLIFTTAATAVITIMMTTGFGSSIWFMTVMIWRQVNSSSPTPDAMHNIGMWTMPPYVFSDMIVTHYGNNESKYGCLKDEYSKKLCKDAKVNFTENYLTVDYRDGMGVGEHCYFLIFQAVFWFSLLILIESLRKRINIEFSFASLCKQVNKVTGGNGQEITEIDIDVKNEEKRVNENDYLKTSNDVLITRNLEKIYNTRTGKLIAVNGLNLGIQPGQCFGLLGVNGAGKTTAFKMLTGDESITNGECYVNGYSLRNPAEKAKAQQSVGYCPQFDALIDQLTGQETLEFYCDLRGLENEDKTVSVETLLKILDLDTYKNKQCGIYSGGNKRKLSVALAMIGDPKLLFLDEPSTGMDPGARHALWNSIMEIQAKGTSVILTSHSMEECEALCSRLAIMVNGQFQCIGAVQHLRSRFGQGYTLEVEVEEKISNTQKVKLRSDLKLNLKQYDVVLKEENMNTLVYDISVNENNNNNVVISLELLFEKLEQIKKRFHLENYSIRQRTLEEMFLNFTKSQRSDERVK